MSESGNKEQFKGWLFKWTNYLRGYQKRWFVLQNGLLSYYRNQAEMSHTCRGTINLANAQILPYDSCTFVIKNSGTQTFHLKAPTEVDRQRWVTALELAKSKALSLREPDSGSEDGEINMPADSKQVEQLIAQINVKLTDLRNFSDTLNHNGETLAKLLTEFEAKRCEPSEDSLVKALKERTTMHKIMLNAMLNSCKDVGDFLSNEGKRWKRMLEYEHSQRQQLQDMVEQLAKQHSSLEKKVIQEGSCSRGIGSNNSQRAANPRADADDSDEEFHDAKDNLELDENQKVFRISLPSSRIPSPAGAGGEQSQQEAFVDEYESDYSDEESKQREDGREFNVIMTKRAGQKAGKLRPVSTNSSDSALAARAARPEAGHRVRRAAIPERPNYSLNLWSIMKNCIGKELTKIPMPVNFSEPLSMLQRITEELEYAACLDRAARAQDQWEQLAHVAAYTISSYSTTTVRTGKPFNPLLGETYEFDRMDDLGWRSFAEQVSHHPPAAAFHVEGKAGWVTWQEFTMSSKFRGKYLSIIPQGIAHLVFPDGNHYTWRKITSTVHNIIVGKLWIDNHGEMDIVNHTTGDVCHLTYKPYSYFSRDVPRKVTGVISDKQGVTRYVLTGTWDEIMEGARVVRVDDSKSKPMMETKSSTVLWKRNQPPPNWEKMYNFTRFAIELNEEEDGVSPTDSRRRPDQRLMEQGLWDEANKEKVRLEEKQRTKRRQRESEIEAAAAEDEDDQPAAPAAPAAAAGSSVPDHTPAWFRQEVDDISGMCIHRFTDEYWTCKEAADWSRCPDLY